jgi:hypothetical protein
MLANDVSLRNLIPAELAKGFGFFQSKPATAFSPVAVTLDELGDAWDNGRVHLTVQSTWNGRKVGMCDAGPEMTFHFGQLIAHIAKTRNVRAGSIVGSGTVSNKGVEQNGRTEWPKGYSCIAEKRCIETIQDGKPTTEFMKFGDTIRIEVKGKDGASIFGAIDQGHHHPVAQHPLDALGQHQHQRAHGHGHAEGGHPFPAPLGRLADQQQHGGQRRGAGQRGHRPAARSGARSVVSSAGGGRRRKHHAQRDQEQHHRRRPVCNDSCDRFITPQKAVAHET